MGQKGRGTGGRRDSAHLIRAVTSAVNVPVICGGGAGKAADLIAGAQAGASALAAAAILHYNKTDVPRLKAELRAGGLEVRA